MSQEPAQIVVDGGEDFGADVSLIRWTLSLSPEERLDCNDDMVNLIEELRSGFPHES